MCVFGRPWLISVQPTKLCVEKGQYWTWGVWFLFTGFLWNIIFYPDNCLVIFARDAHRNARRYSCKIAVKTVQFKWKLIRSQFFRKIIQYDILRKFVKRFLSMCTCVRIDCDYTGTSQRCRRAQKWTKKNKRKENKHNVFILCGGEKRCIQGCGVGTWGKETTWKTQA